MKDFGLSHLAAPGNRIGLWVTLRASRARIVAGQDALRGWVTAPPGAGKDNAAVPVLLAEALGVPKTWLKLGRGHTARDNIFEVL